MKSDSKIMNIVNMLGTGILMNLAFLVCCIPVVTIGHAWCGLYSSIRYNIKGEGWWEGFKEGLKTRPLRNILAWALGLMVGYFALNNFLFSVNTLVEGSPDLVSSIVTLVISGVFTLGAMVFTAVMIPVNLYIPTDAERWLRNTWFVILRAPLQALGVAALVWAPVMLALFATDIAYMLLIVFVASYFTLAGVGATIMLKMPLIQLLLRERAENPEFEG